MNADDVQTLYEEIFFYDIFKKIDDDTETYIGTTHIFYVAMKFCDEHQDCYIKRNRSVAKLMDLEEKYIW